MRIKIMSIVFLFMEFHLRKKVKEMNMYYMEVI